MKTRLLAGLLAGVGITWIGYLAFQWASLPFLPGAFADLFFSLTPGNLQAEGIALLGVLAKPLSLYIFMLGQIMILALASLPKTSMIKWSFHALLILLPLYFAFSLFAASTSWSVVGVLLSSLGIAVGQIALFQWLLWILQPSAYEQVVDESLEARQYNRRQFLAATATLGGSILLWPVVSRALAPPPPVTSNVSMPLLNPISIPPQALDGIPGLPPVVTPTQDFYYVAKNLFVHQGNANEPLKIEGLVETPLTLSINELRDMEAVEEYVTLMCVDYEHNNPNTSHLINNALWKGVPLKDLLDRAGLSSPNLHLEMTATDGFATAIPTEHAFEVPETMIAYEMNGMPLNGRHGFPARLIAPGIYGYKNIKHINRIALRDSEFSGYWEKRGWAHEAPIKMLSRISYPQGNAQISLGEQFWIAGIAYNGIHGVSRIELSLNGGVTWQDAQLEDAISRFSWSRWAYSWTPDELGETDLVVRAYDNQGKAQTATIARAFPNGASGYHKVRVQVVDPA